MNSGPAFVDVVLFRFRERFLAKVVDDASGCRIWLGARNPKGYGVVRVSGRSFLAHRVAFELFRGPIPDGLQLDHLCRNPSCVNVEHLEPVTAAENSRRGHNHQLKKTRCPKGHPYSGDNLVMRGRGRRCRACERTANRSYKRRKRLEEAAV